MSEQAAPTTAIARPTKRLSASRERTILRAVYEVLAESGYQGLRYEAVATRARTSKATLYRHWPTKADLVTTAISCRPAEDLQVPDTGTLRGDLLAYLRLLAEWMSGEQGAVISGLFVTMRNDAELAALLRPLLIPAVPPVRAVCERAEQRGELALDHQDVRFIDELCAPALFMRHALLGLPLDAEFVEYLVDGVAMPLLTRAT
ncbi:MULTISPECIES: TetR/AcrR family transcriptional regulator [unclassified Streptomyces]|uniref:TetR/AcrR family transcriptional regulator n=1 Tax=unclassified Streptomyces TaxID=2593676 RepID=UPI002E81815E|nr:TetR/AcrR family transcriptional regulator [Streptomyces sp. NBC_00569]WSE13445.1 TetR/AcrR family transcriptional regulator [Streptomyces sp. NBC_01397]WUB97639.1 TetR/AcrR family transcriptional regulator [Streptomyces sp. NBC_00569]